MKTFCRICVGNTAALYLVAAVKPFEVSALTGEMSVADWLLVGWGMLTVVIGFAWVGGMLYHWAVSRFRTKAVKAGWFLVLLAGSMAYLLGPLAYYVLVIEMGRGLRPAEV